jgi:hypothetical protein
VEVPTQSEDKPPEELVADAAAESTESGPDVSAAEPSSETPQEDESVSATEPASAESPVEEEMAAAATESTPDETEPDVSPEIDASGATKAAAQSSQPVSDAVVSMEEDTQNSEEIIQAADAQVEQVAAPEEIIAEEAVEVAEQEDNGPHTASETEKELADSPQSDSNVENIASDDIAVAEPLELSDDNPSSTAPPGEDIHQESEVPVDIPKDQPSEAEVAVTPQRAEPSAPELPADSGETGTAEASTESEHTPDSAFIQPLEDPDEIVQIIEVNGDGSTDDTAAIVVLPPSGDTEDAVPPPPPPPPGPHVTIAEPLRPSKSSKRKSSSSKSSKHKHSEKPREKAVEIIQLVKAKSKPMAGGKSKTKGKSMSRKGGEEVGESAPPPPPMVVDVPPRAPSPPPSGIIIEDAGDGEVQVIDVSAEKEEGEAAEDDTTTQPTADNEVIEVLETEEVSQIAVTDQEGANAETTDQKEDVSAADIPSPPQVDVIASPVENGDPGEGTETGTDEDKPQLIHEKSASQPETAPLASEDPPVDVPSDGSPPEDTHPAENPHAESDLAQPVAAESENHDDSQLLTPEEEQTKDAPMAESPVEENGEIGSSPTLNVESQTDGELMSPEHPSAVVSEEIVSSDDTDNGVDEASTQDQTVESASTEGSTVDEEVPNPETVETKSAKHIPSEDTARSVAQCTGDVVVPEAVTAEPDVSTMDPAATGETSEATIGEYNDVSSDTVIVVLPDEENAGDVPPEAPMPPGTEESDTKHAPDDDGEDNNHQASEATTDEVTNGDIQPETLHEATAPVIGSAGDQEPDAEGQSSNEVAIDGAVDSLAAEIPGTDVSIPSADYVLEEQDQGVVDLVEDTIEPSEAVLAIPDEQVPEASEPDIDAAMLDTPAENQAIDISPPAVEEPDMAQTAEEPQESFDQEPGDTSMCQVQESGALRTEEEARVDPVEDGEARDPAAPGTEEASEEVNGVTATPAIVDQHVVDEVERAADEESQAEFVAEESAVDKVEGVVVSDSASEQVETASESLVGESADTEAHGTPEERVPTTLTESPDNQDLSEQPAEPAPELIPEIPDDTAANNIDTTRDATTSPTGDSAQTEDQASSELAVPVLAEEAQTDEVIKVTEATAENQPELGEKETTEAPEPVDTAPLLEETSESNETFSPGEQPMSPAEEPTNEEPKLPATTGPTQSTATAEAVEPNGDAPSESVESGGSGEPDRAAKPEPPGQEPTTEAEILPEDSISQQSRVDTLPDSEPGRRSPLIEEPSLDPPAPVDPPAPDEVAVPPPSKHSSKVSFDEPPLSSKGNEPASPPKERRKSSKSSSGRHSSSRHKVKDVSSPTPDPKRPSVPNQSRRRSSTTKAPPGLFRAPSTTKPRSSRTEAAEQAEIRRRAAELAAREQEVQRQLERARRRVALEEQERNLREKEEELARLRAVEREKKRARRDEQRRREQEALEQERMARERAEEEARQKEFERAERRRRRREAEASESRRQRDDRPRVRRQSNSHRESEVRDPSPTPEPKLRRHKTEDIGVERQRSRDESYIREVPSSSKDPEQRRHRRSSRRDAEKDERPKKGFWKSILGRA